MFNSRFLTAYKRYLMSNEQLITGNELRRTMSLSDFDLDFSDIEDTFKDLAGLAAKIAGAEVSSINLLDLFTQWSVSQRGLSISQVAKEDSICQYTILSDHHFEVKDLSADERFKNLSFVAGEPKLRYYMGVPLQAPDGYMLGSLCVMDHKNCAVPAEKIELLRIIAQEIVHRLSDIKVIHELRNKVKEARETQKKVAHDIRGPLSGIINLAHIITEQGESTQIEEVMEVMTMIQTSGNSLLDFANEILSHEPETRFGPQLQGHELDLLSFKDKLLKLYSPQAVQKHIHFSVTTGAQADTTPFAKNKLLQITGNLVSNAIKFTPENGGVAVKLDLLPGSSTNQLRIKVTDTGIGLSEEQINLILKGTSLSTEGTGGEQGYGFGLTLVKHLVDSMNGTIEIQSEEGAGTSFELALPQSKL